MPLKEMKILFLSDLRKKRNTGFEILKTLKKMGYEVYPVNIKGFLPDVKIKNILKFKKPEVLFTFKGVGKVDYKKIDYKFKKKVVWYPDPDIFVGDRFNENLRDIFEFHDCVFVIVKSKTRELKKILGKENIHFLVQGTRFFEYEIREIPEEFRCDIGFIGSLKGKIYSKRREILSGICIRFGKEYRIKMWGSKPDKRENFYGVLNEFHTGKRVFFEDFKRAVLGSKIIVDIAREDALKEEGALSQKVFMITGCGGFLLMHYLKGIEEFFEIGKEIEVYRSLDEAYKKIEYYLKNEDKRREIAENARKRVLKEHLYENRLKKMFEVCKI